MSIDIVNLIESNPITKLNGNYQSKLVEKSKKRSITINNSCLLRVFTVI